MTTPLLKGLPMGISRPLPLIHQSILRRPATIASSRHPLGRPQGHRTIFTEAVDSVAQGIISLHGATGLPYWLFLPCCALAVASSVVVPHRLVSASQVRKQYKLEDLRWAWDSRLKKLGVENPGAEYASQMRRLRRDMGIAEWKRLAPVFASIPLWITTCVAVRRIAGTVADGPLDPAISTEGLFWFTDMTNPDTTMMLPLLAVGLTASRFVPKSMHDARQLLDPAAPGQRFRRITLTLSAAMLMIGQGWPVAVWYWLASYGLATRVITAAMKQLGLISPGYKATFKPTDNWREESIAILEPPAKGNGSK